MDQGPSRPRHNARPYIRNNQWLMSIILATWEAEIRRITVQDQPGQIVHEAPPFQNKQSKSELDMWVK
jgi:hypothetical protein